MNEYKAKLMKKWKTNWWLSYRGNLFYLLLSLFLLIPAIAFCEKPTDSVQATIIHFSEYEQGSGIYPVSMTITPDFLRIDDTEEGNDFILFNRKKQVIYSVNSENQQIIQIKQMPVTIKSPIELNINEVELNMDNTAPLIAGKKARHYQFFVNDKLCYELISVPDLMSDAVAALKMFKQVLAGQQSETLRSIPGDLHEACDLTRHVFYPQLYLQKGFPIMEKEPGSTKNFTAENTDVNYSRTLINFKEEKVSAKRFVLPDYQVIPIN